MDQDIQELRDGLGTARAAKTNTFTVMKIEDRIRELEAQKKRGGLGAFEVPPDPLPPVSLRADVTQVS